MKTLTITTLLALCATLAAAKPIQQPCLPYNQAGDAPICWTGPQGAGTQQTQRVIRTPEEWKAFWAEHAAGQAPSVDFSKESVVAFTGGDAAAFKAVKVALGSDAAALKEAGVEATTARMDAPSNRVAAMLAGARAAEAKTDSVVSKADFQLAALTGFDSGAGMLRDAVASPVTGGKLIPVGCTPGVDCPAAPKRAPSNCTPGVDCPASAPRRPASRCTPGVDCPGDGRRPSGCTPGVDCPGSGSPSVPTPAPDNYYPRPSNPPSTFPDWRGGNLDRYDREADVSSLWMSQLDVFGDPVEDEGAWTRSTVRGTIERAGSEKGTQGSRYHVTLVSQETRNVYRLYWRYVGYDCDPNDSSRCRSWRVQQAWFLRRTENGRTSAMNVVVRFENDQPLLPWETETIGLTYDGSSVGVDDSYGAFRYSVRGPIVDQQNGVATIELTPTSRRKRAPEFDKVNVRLENRGGALTMIVEDQRAQFYAGENLELVYQVMRKCSGWWECTRNFGDVKVTENAQSAPLVVPVQSGRAVQLETPVPGANGSGEYYLNWYFRRADSKLSDGSWSGWKATPKVTR